MTITVPDVSAAAFHFSTAEVDAAEAVDYWREIRRLVYGGVATSPQHDGFAGTISTAAYGDYAVSTKRASGERIVRTRAHVADGAEQLFAVLPTRGTGGIEQAGNSARFGPGQILFYDSSIPFRMEYSGDYEQVIVHIPAEQAFATAGLARSTELLASPFAVDGALASVTAFFRSLAQAQRSDATGAALLAPQVAGLAGSLLSYAASRPSTEDLPAALRREQVIEYLRAHLSDPDLDVDTVAAACHLSRRSLYRLFDGTDLTVAGQLRVLRVEQAQRLLAAPSGPSVAGVARAVGFPSEARFYRTFRAVTGVTPGEYRRLAGAGGQ